MLEEHVPFKEIEVPSIVPPPHLWCAFCNSWRNRCGHLYWHSEETPTPKLNSIIPNTITDESIPEDKIIVLTDERIKKAAQFAVGIMKHPMFGKFPKPSFKINPNIEQMSSQDLVKFMNLRHQEAQIFISKGLTNLNSDEVKELQERNLELAIIYKRIEELKNQSKLQSQLYINIQSPPLVMPSYLWEKIPEPEEAPNSIIAKQEKEPPEPKTRRERKIAFDED